MQTYFYFSVLFPHIQALGGIFQTSGWPGVVTVVGNWFGKGKRGLIFGVWNSHTSLGNILGSLIAAAYIESDWSLSFIVPGVIMGLVGFFVFLFLIPSPVDIGYSSPASPGYRKIIVTNSSDDDSTDIGYESRSISEDVSFPCNCFTLFHSSNTSISIVDIFLFILISVKFCSVTHALFID